MSEDQIPQQTPVNVPTMDDLQTRIRILEATCAVQRLGLSKASALISEFGGSDNIQAVASDVSNWIGYGLTTPNLEAHETRVRGLVDVLLMVDEFLKSVNQHGFLEGAEPWLLDALPPLHRKITETIQALPPLLRGTVCKLALGCPESHTRDCRREIETRGAGMDRAAKAAEQIITNVVGTLGVPVPQTAADLQFFTELMQVIRFERGEKSAETGRTFISYAGGLLAIADAELAILARYTQIHEKPLPEVIQTETEERPN